MIFGMAGIAQHALRRMLVYMKDFLGRLSENVTADGKLRVRRSLTESDDLRWPQSHDMALDSSTS